VTNTTRETRSKEGGWMNLLVLSVREVGAKLGRNPSAEEILSDMAHRCGLLPPILGGLAESMEVMWEYAKASVEDGVDALDEEGAAISASKRAFQPVLEARLQARIDAVDRETAGLSKCPVCGKSGESKGRRPKTFLSTFGGLTLFRRWCECAGHKKGWAEAERRLQLSTGRHTPRLDESMTLLAAVTTHGMATTLCRSLLGVDVSEHALQDAVERRAEAVVQLQDRQAERLRPAEKNGRPRMVARPSDAVADAPDVAYVEVDGVVPMTRQLDPERSKPVPGHRGGKGRRYTMEGKEVKNAVLYRGDDCCTEGDGRGIVLEKKYVSHLGYWANFAALLWVMMLRLRFDQAGTLILLSDGALWIRELAAFFPREVVLILDLFHAKHRLWEVANAVYGERSAKARLWANTQCMLVEKGDLQTVIKTLKRLRPKRTIAKDKVDELVTYFTNNEDRMDYPTYRANGWRVSSGGVESANYHVTGARLKMQGMRWSVKGAAEMARLRADLANDEWRQRTREVLAA